MAKRNRGGTLPTIVRKTKAGYVTIGALRILPAGRGRGGVLGRRKVGTRKRSLGSILGGHGRPQSWPTAQSRRRKGRR